LEEVVASSTVQIISLGSFNNAKSKNNEIFVIIAVGTLNFTPMFDWKILEAIYNFKLGLYFKQGKEIWLYMYVYTLCR
jgi:hypothetical protein